MRCQTPHLSVPLFSNRDAVYDDLAAPGQDIFSTVPRALTTHNSCLDVGYSDCGPEDYRRAGIPMLPVVASLRRVGLETVVYTWLTVVASVALWPLGMTPSMISLSTQEKVASGYFRGNAFR